jgi:hypothetical protein
MNMLIVIVILILPVALAAQSFWLERNQERAFLLEIFKPKTAGSGVFNGASYPIDYSFATSALFFSLRQPIGGKISLVAEYELGRISLGVNAGIRMSDLKQSEIKTAYTRGGDFNVHQHLGLAASVRLGN